MTKLLESVDPAGSAELINVLSHLSLFELSFCHSHPEGSPLMEPVVLSGTPKCRDQAGHGGCVLRIWDQACRGALLGRAGLCCVPLPTPRTAPAQGTKGASGPCSGSICPWVKQSCPVRWLQAGRASGFPEGVDSERDERREMVGHVPHLKMQRGYAVSAPASHGSGS